MSDSPEELLEHLDPEQRKVATALNGPICVRAGAGTGKTRAITYRIAYGARVGAFDPSHLLALTFTNRAAGEMRSRLADLRVPGVQARTFHSAALRQLTYFWSHAVGGRCPEVASRKMPLMYEAAGRAGITADGALMRDLAGEVEWAKSSLVAPAEYAARAAAAGRGEVGDVAADDIGRLMEAYEMVKTERGVIDFDDALLLLIGIMLDDASVASTIRRQYSTFVVDEYQDVSPLQHRLLQLWLGGSKELCVVGDAAQTIYSFAGATSSYLTGFPKEFPGATVIELVRDYRSSPQIVKAANSVISAGSQIGAVRLVSQLPSSVPVSFEQHGTAEEEAKAVAQGLARLSRQGIPYGEMAVLYRTNSQSADFEAALAEAGIPYQMAGGERFFARAEVRAAMAQLTLAARAPSGAGLVADVETVLRQCGWQEKEPERAGQLRERWDALNSLRNLAEDMARARGATMQDFVDELKRRAAEVNPPNTDAVTLSSLHAAKGLEWDAVFLTGMHEGLMPISYATSPDQVEEERRLMYVGITRAKQHLRISAVGGEGRRARKRSRFLTSIWPEQDSRPVSRATSYRRRAKEESEAFARDYPEDVALLRALKEWRSAKAQETGKPAYTIFHDTTLRSIAISKPATLSQLGHIGGIGATKLARWGEDVLKVVAENR